MVMKYGRHLWGNEEADPGDDDKETGGQVVHGDVLELVPDEAHLEPGEGEVVAGGHVELGVHP